MIEISGILGTVEDNKYSLAASIEILHYATLLHDDVIDNCRFRRKNQSLNAVFGDKIAILTGDLLFGLAGRILTECRMEHLYPYIIDTVVRMSTGELTELRMRNGVAGIDMEIDDYLTIVDDKTGALFGLAFLFSSEKDREVNGIFYEKGVQFGRYFQIIDDTKDYMLDLSDSTKPVFNDFISGVLTYPLILLLQRADQKDREYIKGRFGNIDAQEEDDIGHIRNIFYRCGIFSDIYRRIENNLFDIFSSLDFGDLSCIRPIIEEMLLPISIYRGK